MNAPKSAASSAQSSCASPQTQPLAHVHWEDLGEAHSAVWRAENGAPPPKRVIVADDTLTADAAFRLASEGTAMLWRGDFNNARQLLQAIARRLDTKKPVSRKRAAKAEEATAAEAFHLHRQAQAQRARTLGMVLIPLSADYSIPLRRAPDLAVACAEAYGPADANTPDSIVSLREVLGLVGAHEWRKKGVPFPELDGQHIHAHYGVFSPLRGEYVKLVAEANLPSALKKNSVAFDIGTGTGVLAVLLAKRGVQRIVATDNSPRALVCAADNVARYELGKYIKLVNADLFPEGQAPLIVCNPPWVPARPSSVLEHAVYDFESAMLRGFLNGLPKHLTDDGEGWLILSDLAEHLGLRTREQLLGWIDEAGLKVLGRRDVRPHHPKASDKGDALFAARSAEVTTLWRLAVKPAA